jgi:antitoxin component YwqK of YwqJK toxin-antitoxin module
MKYNIFKQLLLIFLFFITISLSASSQDSTIFYDISKTKIVPLNEAAIISFINKEDTGWLKMDYYTYSQKLCAISRYLDKELKIENGAFKSYHGNELIANKGFYKIGKKHGLFESYYPNGFMQDSCKYINDIPSGNCISWYPDGSIQKLVQVDTTGNSTGIVVGYFPNGTVSFKGRIAKGMRKIGIWNYYHENGNKASILKYPSLDESILNSAPELKYDNFENVSYDAIVDFLSATCFDENGIEQDGCKINNSISQHNEGQMKWIKSLNDRFRRIGMTRKEDSIPLAYVSYISIGTDGNVNDVSLSNKIDNQLDSAIRNIFLKSNAWIPAMNNNRKIPFLYTHNINIVPNGALNNQNNTNTKRILKISIESRTLGGIGFPLNQN